MTDPVLVPERGAVLVITINRPRQRNAVNRAVSLGIAAALDLTGVGPRAPRSLQARKSRREHRGAE